MMRFGLWYTIIFGLAVSSCNNESCADGKQNQNETGLDCGGACEPCATCSDGILNQDEVAVDCGGGCDPCPINYPETGTYGTNILNENVLTLAAGDYSLRAEVPQGSTFKVILYSVTGGLWTWTLGTNTNCIISDATSSQSFEAAAAGLMQVKVSFSGTGSCYIQYFENSAGETKGKTITWS